LQRYIAQLGGSVGEKGERKGNTAESIAASLPLLDHPASSYSGIAEAMGGSSSSHADDSEGESNGDESSRSADVHQAGSVDDSDPSSSISIPWREGMIAMGAGLFMQYVGFQAVEIFLFGVFGAVLYMLYTMTEQKAKVVGAAIRQHREGKKGGGVVGSGQPELPGRYGGDLAWTTFTLMGESIRDSLARVGVNEVGRGEREEEGKKGEEVGQNQSGCVGGVDEVVVEGEGAVVGESGCDKGGKVRRRRKKKSGKAESAHAGSISSPPPSSSSLCSSNSGSSSSTSTSTTSPPWSSWEAPAVERMKAEEVKGIEEVAEHMCSCPGFSHTADVDASAPGISATVVVGSKEIHAIIAALHQLSLLSHLDTNGYRRLLSAPSLLLLGSSFRPLPPLLVGTALGYATSALHLRSFSAKSMLVRGGLSSIALTLVVNAMMRGGEGGGGDEKKVEKEKKDTSSSNVGGDDDDSEKECEEEEEERDGQQEERVRADPIFAVIFAYPPSYSPPPPLVLPTSEMSSDDGGSDGEIEGGEEEGQASAENIEEEIAGIQKMEEEKGGKRKKKKRGKKAKKNA